MKIIRLILEALTWISIAIIAMMALYIVSANYNIFNNYRSYLVQSGSMEPAIMTGDIIITRPNNKYMVNDVITFKNEENRTVTHRIIESFQKDNLTNFNTKGDANRSEDSDSISINQVIGKVVLVIPKLGFLVAFSKSPPGLILLVLFPAALFILDEIFKIKNA